MFESVFDNFKKVTETTLRMQQETYEKWVSLWPGGRPAQVAFPEPAQKFMKKWAEFFEETLKRQRETLEAQFKAGLKNIEDSFHLAEAKNPEELRTKTAELWQGIFETLRQASEAQLRDFQTFTGRWVELVTKGAA
jgi:DNA gyrase inhibitor GyrI